jgi:hypothetical protein
MPLPKTVTAQDFINLCESTNVHDEVDALLSRARHEAISECESNNLKKIQEARREALKEMDEAHGGCSIQKGRWGEVGKLRAEYLNQP